MFFYIWNEKKEEYFSKLSMIKNVKEYHQAFLNSGRPLCTETFGVETDLKKCNVANEDDFETNVNWPNDTDPCSSSDKDDTGIQDQEVIEAVKSTQLKYSVTKQLASRAKCDVHSTASSLNFVESVLLLLSNARYTESDDETTSARRVDAMLSGYGFQRVAMPKDGDCLFSAVAFQLQSRYASEEKDSPLYQHLHTLGIKADQPDLQIIVQKLRALTVKEFFGGRRSEYVSYLDSSHRDEFENMANNFVERGFFDCELGNATPLALANILQVPLVIMSSIENFPVIPIIPREPPLTNVPIYIAYQRVGSGHYDATVEAQHGNSATTTSVLHSETDSNQDKDRMQPEGALKQITAGGCRCGRGSAKNKKGRQFCHIYRDKCKCFQSVKGCTSTCACFNCGNPHGKRPVTNPATADPIPRKRRKPAGNDVLTGSESQFMESRGLDVIAPPWSTLEELLFKECVCHVTDMDAVDIPILAKMYNSAVKKYCASSSQPALCKDVPRERNSKDIEKMLSKMRKEDKVFRVVFTKQIQLNFDASGKNNKE